MLDGTPQPLDGAHILLVDDEPSVLKVFARTLETAGYRVDTARTGVEATRRIRHRDYEAIVSDITMPELDGIALLRQVRARDLDLPVILVTGGPTLDTAIKAVELGALRYLTKPIASRDLIDAVGQAVRLRRVATLRRQLAESAGHARGIGDVTGLQVHFDTAVDALYLDYQPIVAWTERQVVGYEALVRTSVPHLSSPGALFDVAERLDQLPKLGRAIRAKCAGRALPGSSDMLLFVNLHTRDLLDTSLYEDAEPLNALASRVVLEITERAKLEQIDDIGEKVSRLRARGFRVAIDDIGAGYAGLNSFAQLEPDVVKLDMELVRNVDLNPTKQQLIRALCTLCRELGMLIVAEGVETRAERDALLELGCDWLQGYYFAKPGPPFVVPSPDTLRSWE